MGIFPAGGSIQMLSVDGGDGRREMIQQNDAAGYLGVVRGNRLEGGLNSGDRGEHWPQQLWLGGVNHHGQKLTRRQLEYRAMSCGKAS